MAQTGISPRASMSSSRSSRRRTCALRMSSSRTSAIASTRFAHGVHLSWSGFLRAQHSQVEKFARYYLNDMEDAQQRMYDNELAHATGYAFLSLLPVAKLKH